MSKESLAVQLARLRLSVQAWDILGPVSIEWIGLDRVIERAKELEAELDQCLTAHATLNDKVCELETENTGLKNQHKDLVNRCAFLRQRPDLPADRIPAYNELKTRIEELEGIIKRLQSGVY